MFQFYQRKRISCTFLAMMIVGKVVAEDEATLPKDLFDSKVAPILEKHCLKCHYPGNEKGDISLSTPNDLKEGGYLTLRTGNQSYLLDLIQASPKGEPPEMPKDADPLNSKEIKAIQSWVVQGAPWPEGRVLKEAAKADETWWAFQPLKHAAIPVTSDAPDAWEQNPVDAFVLKGLRDQGLEPSPPAERDVLIRRLTYDLTGLPPSPQEIESFEHDETPDAYERLVDRLLASPHYGERWGRHWLDVIRFGESRGFERNEIIRNAWPFRDYVIRSFNEDKPLSRLIREHLAGDQIGPNDPDVEIGTTYLVCGPYDDVGNQDPAQAAQIRANTIDEIIRATSEAFLGLTVGCARCHHHKFDPISQEDYYSWYATFAGVRHGSREISSETARTSRLEALKPLDEERSTLLASKQSLESEVLQRAESKAETYASKWDRDPIQRTGVEETFEPVMVQYVRLVVEGTERNPAGTSGYGIDEFEVWTAGANTRNVALLSIGAKAQGASRIAEDFADAYSASLTIDGKFGARWIAQGRELTITLAEPTEVNRVFFSSDRVGDAGNHSVASFVSEYRIEVSSDGENWIKVADSHDRLPISDAHRNHRWMSLETTDEESRKIRDLNRQIAKIDRSKREVPDLPQWWAGNFSDIKDTTHVFIGGNPQRKGKEVVPTSLSALNAATGGYVLKSDADEPQRRLAMADWLVDDRNPLTPRVWANRIWQKHFGRGLVDTPSDFGFMGNLPSHPEFLDFLAIQLLENGWRTKSIHKMLVMSQAYRQASDIREAAARVDADSKWLWRFPPRRLSAEEIRDTMLQVSGSLKRDMGGPGFLLYRYLQDNVATYVPLDEHGPETYRRAVYHHNARAAVVDLMTEFDCPDPAFPAPKRASTTTPLQALTLLNHSFTMDMAQALSDDLDRFAGSNDADWVDQAFLRCFGYKPSEVERQQAMDFKTRLGGPLFCRALFNANAFIHID